MCPTVPRASQVRARREISCSAACTWEGRGCHHPDAEKRKQELYQATTPVVGYRLKEGGRIGRVSDRVCRTLFGWVSSDVRRCWRAYDNHLFIGKSISTCKSTL